jgi:hypothetical protein
MAIFFETVLYKVNSNNLLIFVAEDLRNHQFLLWADDFQGNNRVNATDSKIWHLCIILATLPRWYIAKETNWWTIYSISQKAIKTVDQFNDIVSTVMVL